MSFGKGFDTTIGINNPHQNTITKNKEIEELNLIITNRDIIIEQQQFTIESLSKQIEDHIVEITELKTKLFAYEKMSFGEHD